MPYTPSTPQEKQRLSADKRALRKALKTLGHDTTVGVTGYRNGGPAVAYATLPLTAAESTTELEAAGFIVRVGHNTVTILTGETA